MTPADIAAAVREACGFLGPPELHCVHHLCRCPEIRCLIDLAVTEERERCVLAIQNDPYQCDCGEAYQDCNAGAHHISAIREGR